MDEFEKDVEEWHRIHRSDPESLVGERLTRLVAQKNEARLAAQRLLRLSPLT